jgi:hypothetical protein
MLYQVVHGMQLSSCYGAKAFSFPPVSPPYPTFLEVMRMIEGDIDSSDNSESDIGP